MSHRAAVLAVLLSVLAACGGKGPEPDDAAYAVARQVLTERGPFEAVAHLKAEPDSVLAVRLVNRLMHHLYREKQDLPRAVVLGRAGLRMASDRAALLAASDPEKAKQVKTVIRSIAYHLAFMTCPTWDEPGIRIRVNEVEIGRKAALLCRALDEELGSSAEKRSGSWWLLGVHLLVAEEYEAAREALGKSRALAEGADRSLMVDGFLALTKLLATTSSKEGETEFRDIVESLRVLGDDSSVFYADQLETARRVLLRKLEPRPEAPERVDLGPVTLEIRDSRAAKHFAVMASLARGEYGEDVVPRSADDQKRLDRFSGLLTRRPDLGRFFVTGDAPAGALFEAAGARTITPAEVTDLSEMFAGFSSRIDALLADRQVTKGFVTGNLDVPGLTTLARKAARFTAVEKLALAVYPVPASRGRQRARLDGGRVVLAVASGADFSPDLAYGIALAFLAERADDILPVAAAAARQAGVKPHFVRDGLAAWLVGGDPFVAARNLESPEATEAVRTVLATESVDLMAPDPLASFLKQAGKTIDVFDPKPK